jgi:dihydropyrimidinase
MEGGPDFDLVVVNGLLVTHEQTGAYDVAIREGKVVRVVSRGDLQGVRSKRVIDAEGGYVMVSV